MSDHVKGMTSCRPPESEISNEKSNESQIDLINRIAIRHIQTAVDVDPWAVEIAVEAMQKQIPKKPKYKAEDRFVKNHFAVYSYCPVCEKEVVAGDMHCVQCGQAIDWEGKR